MVLLTCSVTPLHEKVVLYVRRIAFFFPFLITFPNPQGRRVRQQPVPQDSGPPAVRHHPVCHGDRTLTALRTPTLSGTQATLRSQGELRVQGHFYFPLGADKLLPVPPPQVFRCCRVTEEKMSVSLLYILYECDETSFNEFNKIH